MGKEIDDAYERPPKPAMIDIPFHFHQSFLGNTVSNMIQTAHHAHTIPQGTKSVGKTFLCHLDGAEDVLMGISVNKNGANHNLQAYVVNKI